MVASDIRCSYAFDEDDVLTYVSFTKPSEFDFDFRLYHWGTLHFSFLLPWLEAAEKLGYIGGAWRTAYYNMLPGSFERVYVAGRVLSMLIALLAIVLVFLLGKEFQDGQTGLWAAALVAASPAHLLASVQIRVDSTMLALVTLTAWLGLRALRYPRPALFFCLGLTAALSVTAKYPAALVVAPVVAAGLWRHRFHLSYTGAAAMGLLAGLVIGQPYVLVRGQAMFHQLYEIFATTQQVPESYRPSMFMLLGLHATHASRFLRGLLLWSLPFSGSTPCCAAACARDWLLMFALWRRRAERCSSGVASAAISIAGAPFSGDRGRNGVGTPQTSVALERRLACVTISVGRELRAASLHALTAPGQPGIAVDSRSSTGRHAHIAHGTRTAPSR